MANRVFVAQENPRVDIISATKWGELIPLANPGRLVSLIKRKLKDFSDDDWLLAIGDPAIIGVAFAVASDVNNGRVNILKWDKIERIYYPVRISIRGGIEELNH
jgi:hypothetical protein